MQTRNIRMFSNELICGSMSDPQTCWGDQKAPLTKAGKTSTQVSLCWGNLYPLHVLVVLIPFEKVISAGNIIASHPIPLCLCTFKPVWPWQWNWELWELKFPSCKRWTCFPPNSLMHIPASPESHGPGMMCGNSNWQNSQWWEAEIRIIWKWTLSVRKLSLFTQGKAKKLPPARKDKIERMRHKSFLVYLLALYVIGWK